MRSLTGRIEEISGADTAKHYLSLVGGDIGNEINNAYISAINEQVEAFSLGDVANLLVDLKRRIGGEFYIVKIAGDKIVFRNAHCPFGHHVIDRPSFCMMTSNVFGHITAAHFSYANVEIRKAIARGDEECEVVINLDAKAYAAVDTMREYYSKE